MSTRSAFCLHARDGAGKPHVRRACIAGDVSCTVWERLRRRWKTKRRNLNRQVSQEIARGVRVALDARVKYPSLPFICDPWFLATSTKAQGMTTSRARHLRKEPKGTDWNELHAYLWFLQSLFICSFALLKYRFSYINIYITAYIAFLYVTIILFRTLALMKFSDICN